MVICLVNTVIGPYGIRPLLELLFIDCRDLLLLAIFQCESLFLVYLHIFAVQNEGIVTMSVIFQTFT